MDEIEVRELRYFLAVAQELNFTRAAARLGIAQPPLSAAIAKLERKIGVPLFERSSRRVALTAAGTVLLEQGRVALESFGAALERTRRTGTHPHRLTVAVKAGGGTDLLRSIVHRCADDPAIPEVHVLFGHYGEQSAALRGATADVALLRVPFDARGLDTEVLLVEPRVVALAANHPLAGRRELHRADLAGQPMPRWEPHDDTVAAYWAAQAADPAGPSPSPRAAGAHDGHDGHDGTRPATGTPGTAAAATIGAAENGPRVTDINELLDAAALGQTLAFLPLSAAHQYNRADLVFRPVLDLAPSTLVAAWPHASRSRAVAAFVRTAASIAREFADPATALA
jgi:DNA-binding transcriptional LysR family regulator